jgi:spore coat polysaccharide biosynthesis protein SpsF (cytidylyltransferase family)/sialic acid synthase SpsE
MIKYEQLVPEIGCVVAEIACGHEGDIGKFSQLLDAIAESGTQIVKFQIFTPPERATEDHPEWDIFNDLALSERDWGEAAAYARQLGLTIFADVFGPASFAIAKGLEVDGYKIHSEDLLNTDFIANIAAEGKILMIGVGGAHRIEIYNLLNYLKERDLLARAVLMPGVQTFPTPLGAHSLDEVCDLIEKYSFYGVKVGFADHVSGDAEEALVLPLMALAKGACLVEKHITVDRGEQWEDFESALDKDEFKRFVGYVKSMAPLLQPVARMNPYETKYRQTFKKTPVPVGDLPQGHRIVAEDIEYQKRADVKVPIASLNLLGKELKAAISATTPLRFSHLEQKVGGVIVARCTSSRLPNKALMKIQDRESVALLVERIKRCRNLDLVVLATSTESSDDALVEIAEREGIASFRGSLDNLSLRFFETAKHYGLDHVVRITGDDILRDEVMIDRGVESHLQESCDVTFTENMPYGAATEIFSINALETILATANVPTNTEYLEYYLGNDRYFSINRVRSDYEFSDDLRMTLDYEEDFQFFTRVFEHFYPETPQFTLADLIGWLRENPSPMDINKHKTVKFGKEDIDVSLNI